MLTRALSRRCTIRSYSKRPQCNKALPHTWRPSTHPRRYCSTKSLTIEQLDKKNEEHMKTVSEAVKQHLGLEFKDRNLLLAAFTDTSYEDRRTVNDRLAQLGKQYLRLHYLCNSLPNQLRDWKQSLDTPWYGERLISAHNLAGSRIRIYQYFNAMKEYNSVLDREYASKFVQALKRFGLENYLRCGDVSKAALEYDPNKNHDADPEKYIYSRCFLALLGAIYLDQGHKAANKFLSDALNQSK